MSKYFDGKRVLVTGATGLIGSNLVERLIAEGANVVALSRSESKLKNVFSKLIDTPQFSYCAQDTTSSIKNIMDKGIDVVFHAASPMSPYTIGTEPLSVIKPNILGLLNILDSVVEAKTNTRCIVFSSVTVYGSKAGTYSEIQTESADSLNSANGAYSESKRMSEIIAQAYVKQYGLDIVIVRPSYVYGYSKEKPNTAFYQFIDNAVRGKDITLTSSLFNKRDSIYVDDVVSGLLLVAERGQAAEAYNISSNGEGDSYATIDEIAGYIAKAAAVNGIRIKVSKPIQSQATLGVALNNAKLKELGWMPKVSLPSGVMMCFQKYFVQE